ncbi:MAG: DUF2399 domain-containing protein [Verrucomicrobia bacterium]|nr:DUF2399 domain-containing protein [Verrucomicrobiota bacterium]
MTDAHDRLRDLFRDPAWTWLRDRIRRSLELDHALPSRFVRKHPSEAELRAARSLMGRSLQSPKGTSISLSRDELESILRSAGLCESLREMVEIVDGPLHLRAALRREREAAWDALRQTWSHATAEPDAFFLGLRRLAGGDPETGQSMLLDLDRLLREMDSEDQLPTRTAARLFGNSHALDGDRPLTRLLALHAGHPPGETRSLWRRFGLTPDEVSSTILTLGIRFREDHSVARAANALAGDGIPNRMLLRHFRQPCTPNVPEVFVCENPAVLEAAAESGVRAALVCTEGQPSHACLRLLDACSAAGIPIHLRADFDAAGLHIVNFLHRRYPAADFWHFDPETYTAAPSGPPLEANLPDTPWNPALSAVMSQTGHAVHEEQILPRLMLFKSKLPQHQVHNQIIS